MIHARIRAGATLTEVLVAIFVMAIGLLALLTLFPLGALSMAQAIKDNRTAHSGKNAFAITGALNIHGDQTVLNISNPQIAGTPLTGIAAYQGAPPLPNTPANSTTLFLNPFPDVPQSQPATSAVAASLPPDLATNPTFGNWDGPSYPIYVDPFAWKNFGSSYRWVGYDPTTQKPWNPLAQPAPAPVSGLLPRLPLSALLTGGNPTQWLDRWCTLSDDITFNEDGTPSTNTGAIQRENRYTWAWLLRRPKANDATVVDVTVVVYSGRSVTSPGETAFQVAFDTTSKFVDITYSGTKPSIRTGSWILDATLAYVTPVPMGTIPAGTSIPDPHGFFYRVVGVTDVNSNTMRLELQTYPRKSSFITAGGNVVSYGVLVVMENVVEVFEKGPGWQP